MKTPKAKPSSSTILVDTSHLLTERKGVGAVALTLTPNRTTVILICFIYRGPLYNSICKQTIREHQPPVLCLNILMTLKAITLLES